jgi:hypothetical protein
MEEPQVAPTAAPAVAEPAIAPVVEPTTALNVDPAAASPALSKEEIFTMFKESAGEELQGHSYMDKYKTAEDFAKAGINHQSAFTQKASDYLGSDDPVIVAERNKFFGVPDSGDAYEISSELTESISEEGVASFRTMAHELELPQKFVEPLMKFEADLWAKNAENVEAAKVAEKEATTTELRETWKGDAFDANTKQVQNLLIGELGLSQEDLAMPIGNNAKLITALFDKIVPMFGSDKLIEGSMSQTISSASERMGQLRQEMHGTPSNTPAYAALKAEMSGLMAKVR